MEMTSNLDAPKRLYKSRRNKMIDGVCGGIAEYFDVDPTIVRVVWVLFTLLGGTGILLYLAAMIIMPTNPDIFAAAPQPVHAEKKSENRRFWGIVLILVGALILLANLGAFAMLDWFDLSWEVLFPVMLILLGLWFIFIYMRKPEQQTVSAPGPAAWTMPGSEGTEAATASQDASTPPPQANAWPRRKELRRSLTDRKLFGVCGGIAKYFEIDPTVVRVAYVLLVIGSVGWGLLLYIILAFLVPEEKFSDVWGNP